MTDITRPLPGYGDFGGRTWLNTAHQGALPLAAAEAAREAIAWKVSPSELTQERFDSVPLRLREALGELVNVPADDIILGNSASRGLHIIANALDWKAVAERRRPYKMGEVPLEVIKLTAGIDVQMRSLYYVIRGWGSKARSWLIDAGQLIGPTDKQENFPDIEFIPSTKGRYIERLRAKLRNLSKSSSNEIVPGNMAEILDVMKSWKKNGEFPRTNINNP